MATPVVPHQLERPGVVTGMAIFDVLVGGLYLLGGISVAVAGHEQTVMLVMGAVVAFVGLAHLAAGLGLFLLAPWGRMLQFAICALGLLGFPCGTLLYGVMLYYLTRPGIALVFSGRAPAELTPAEWEQVRGTGGNAGLVLIAAAALSLLMIPIVGIMAAIAIPSLLRARVSANEAATIGCVRTIVSAEGAYQSVNGGYYDTLECLRAPSSCIPGYAATSPKFLDGACGEPVASGYRFTFHPGPAAPAADPAVSSPSSLEAWAIVAVPTTRNQTGVRSFCGDASGVVCAQASGDPEPEEGACPASCRPLK